MICLFLDKIKLFKESFNNINKWIEEINQYGNNKFLIGNKSDLTNQRKVEYEMAKKLSDSLGISYIETSSKDSTNVEEAFRLIVNESMSNILSIPVETSNMNDKPDIKRVESPILIESD
jgi:Ras-related protein Rab-1A